MNSQPLVLISSRLDVFYCYGFGEYEWYVYGELKYVSKTQYVAYIYMQMYLCFLFVIY